MLWLPVAEQPYPAEFADRAGPGSSDFYYYALDAFEAISLRRPREFEREPWAYVLDGQQILSPAEIDQLMDEWREPRRRNWPIRTSISTASPMPSARRFRRIVPQRMEDEAGQATSAYLYGIANLYYDLLEGARTDVAEVKFTSENDPLWSGLGVGGSYNWGDGKYALHGEASLNTSLRNFGDSYAAKGTVGLSVQF